MNQEVKIAPTEVDPDSNIVITPNWHYIGQKIICLFCKKPIKNMSIKNEYTVINGMDIIDSSIKFDHSDCNGSCTDIGRNLSRVTKLHDNRNEVIKLKRKLEEKDQIITRLTNKITKLEAEAKNLAEEIKRGDAGDDDEYEEDIDDDVVEINKADAAKADAIKIPDAAKVNEIPRADAIKIPDAKSDAKVDDKK